MGLGLGRVRGGGHIPALLVLRIRKKEERKKETRRLDERGKPYTLEHSRSADFGIRFVVATSSKCWN